MLRLRFLAPLAACAATALASCSSAATGPLDQPLATSTIQQNMSNQHPTALLDAHTGTFVTRARNFTSSEHAARAGWLLPAAKGQRLIYVADYAQNAVLIYPANQSNPTPIGMITDGINTPLGIYVDSFGTLYVANNKGNTVTEYAEGTTTPQQTLSTGIIHPVAVSVARGIVAVSDADTNTVQVFKKHSTSPDVTITSITGPGGLTNDASGNLYVGWNNPPSAGVAECPSLSTSCTDLQLSGGQFSVGDVKIDSAGNLAVSDQVRTRVNIYQPGSPTPLRSITTTLNPFRLSLQRNNANLYSATSEFNSVVEIYNYASGASRGTISSGLESASGVALSPSQRPGP